MSLQGEIEGDSNLKKEGGISANSHSNTAKEVTVPSTPSVEATMETAKLLRIEEDLGSLEVGKIADIIAIDGNPLDNPADMKNVVFVMKEGKIYKQN